MFDDKLPLKTKYDSIPESIQLELQELFEKTLTSETGAIHVPCPPPRAKYLMRMGISLRNEGAIISTQTLPEDHPLYGLGVYWHFGFAATDEGLFIFTQDNPPLSVDQIILYCSYAKRVYLIPEADKEKREKLFTRIISRANKLRNRYHDEGLRTLRILADERGVLIRPAGMLLVKTASREKIDQIRAGQTESDEPLDTNE
jgi:hypothetical protein